MVADVKHNHEILQKQPQEERKYFLGLDSSEKPCTSLTLNVNLEKHDIPLTTISTDSKKENVSSRGTFSKDSDRDSHFSKIISSILLDDNASAPFSVPQTPIESPDVSLNYPTVSISPKYSPNETRLLINKPRSDITETDSSKPDIASRNLNATHGDLVISTKKVSITPSSDAAPSNEQDKPDESKKSATHSQELDLPFNKSGLSLQKLDSSTKTDSYPKRPETLVLGDKFSSETSTINTRPKKLDRDRRASSSSITKLVKEPGSTSEKFETSFEKPEILSSKSVTKNLDTSPRKRSFSFSSGATSDYRFRKPDKSGKKHDFNFKTSETPAKRSNSTSEMSGTSSEKLITISCKSGTNFKNIIDRSSKRRSSSSTQEAKKPDGTPRKSDKSSKKPFPDKEDKSSKPGTSSRKSPSHSGVPIKKLDIPFTETGTRTPLPTAESSIKSSTLVGKTSTSDIKSKNISDNSNVSSDKPSYLPLAGSSKDPDTFSKKSSPYSRKGTSSSRKRSSSVRKSRTSRSSGSSFRRSNSSSRESNSVIDIYHSLRRYHTKIVRRFRSDTHGESSRGSILDDLY